jgi:6-phosphofructokinase 1
VYGIRGGYKGFYDKDLPPFILTPQVVENIHHQGGTFLGSSRGGFDLEKILHFLKSKKIKQLYVIGGDGTHRGAFRIHEGCMEAVRDCGRWNRSIRDMNDERESDADSSSSSLLLRV